MRARDKAIIDDLARFRVMSRDDIADIHFSGVKSPENGANSVLKRLHRDRLIERSNKFVPFVYMPADKSLKKDSAKIPHFLELVQVYRQMIRYKKPKIFRVEPKLGPKTHFAEPDIFAIWRGGVFWIEVQRSLYSEAVMAEKIARYESYVLSELWKAESWQPEGRAPILPVLLIITPHIYGVRSLHINIVETGSIDELVVKAGEQRKPEVRRAAGAGGIKMDLR
ncbi:hypothetical protein [Metabacillus sp. RGM 3146]|uniref:hypothetical protein n=1 Tax=Metabacillus sp. RGM 3146 TaxID=3401092 RepID=UPI003B9B79D5